MKAERRNVYQSDLSFAGAAGVAVEFAIEFNLPFFAAFF